MLQQRRTPSVRRFSNLVFYRFPYRCILDSCKGTDFLRDEQRFSKIYFRPPCILQCKGFEYEHLCCDCCSNFFGYIKVLIFKTPALQNADGRNHTFLISAPPMPSVQCAGIRRTGYRSWAQLVPNRGTVRGKMQWFCKKCPSLPYHSYHKSQITDNSYKK